MTPQTIVVPVLKLSIMLTVFGFGLQATRDNLLYLIRKPVLTERFLVAMFVIMPLVAILLPSVFNFQSPVMIALIALSISPVEPLLPRKIGNGGGGVAPYGLAFMITAAALSILYISLATRLFGGYFDKPFSVGPGPVAKLISMSVLVPIAAGILFQRVVSALARCIAKPAALIATILLTLGFVAILVFLLAKSLSLIGNGTLVALIAFIVVGLVVGYFWGGPNADERITLSLSTACRHPSLAITQHSVNVPQEHNAFGAVPLYLLLSAVITSAYVFWRRLKIQAPPNHSRNLQFE
jgi:BASS family bile acid:Na+ symporter